MSKLRKDKMTAVEKVVEFHAHKPAVSFISGKWFNDDIEIKNINSYLLKTGWFRGVNDMQEFKDVFRMMYGDPYGDWPPMPIINHARLSKDLPPVPDIIDLPKLKIINYLLRHNEEYFIIITGVGGSGKSTFINIIRQIFEGDEAAITLHELGEGFRLATAIDKRLIYSTEIDAARITDVNIKKIVSGEPLNVNPKYEKGYQARFQAGFIFNCNTPPSINLADTGLLRRIVYYSMNKKIENPDPSMNKKKWSKEEILSIVKAALEVDMSDFPQCFEKDTKDALINEDTVYKYKDETNYFDYRTRCMDDGFKPYNRKNWEVVRRLLLEWGYITQEEKSLSTNSGNIWNTQG